MLPRYTVRAQGDLQYSVWDNERDKLAVLIDRKCANLTFADAFKLADDLNAEPPVTLMAWRARTGASAPVAQGQQSVTDTTWR